MRKQDGPDGRWGMVLVDFLTFALVLSDGIVVMSDTVRPMGGDRQAGAIWARQPGRQFTDKRVDLE